jgi:hypothetical protein
LFFAIVVDPFEFGLVWGNSGDLELCTDFWSQVTMWPHSQVTATIDRYLVPNGEQIS